MKRLVLRFIVGNIKIRYCVSHNILQIFMLKISRFQSFITSRKLQQQCNSSNETDHRDAIFEPAQQQLRENV